MKELLNKLREYSKRKGFDVGYTLVIETDESGFICKNPFEKIDERNRVFDFNSIYELRKELTNSHVKVG